MSPAVFQERDRLPGRLLSAIGIAWIVLTILAVAWAVDLDRIRQQALGTPPATRTLVAPVEIGVVDQTQIRTTHLAEQHRARGQEQLRRWGWVDPANGRLHMPAEAAMRILLGEPP